MENIIFNGNKVWLTSDTHYNHSNICKATSSWRELSEGHLGVRNFNTLEEMNNEIINNINKYVKQDDILFHLGDWSFGGIESIAEFRKKIICKNIYLILGNHDHHIEKNKKLPKEQQEEIFKYLKHYLNKQNLIYGNITTQDLFTEVCNVKQIKVQFSRYKKAIPIFLSHYSHRVWNKHHKGWYHAFGHSHGSLDYLINGRSIDVGIDTAFVRYKTYRPYQAKEFIDICYKQDVQFIDHHNTNTN